MQKNKESSYLIISPSWVGDMVMTQTLFKLIKKHEPLSKISVAASPWSLSVASRMPEVSNLIPMDFKHGELSLLKRYEFAKTLKCKFDNCIILPSSLKSALIPYFSKIPKRIGYIGKEFRGFLLTDKKRLNKDVFKSTIQQFSALYNEEEAKSFNYLKEHFTPELLIDKENQEKILNRFSLKKGESIFAICPGAEFGGAKKWPIEYFSKVAEKAHKSGYKVITLGSKNDIKTTSKIKDIVPSTIDTAGKTDLLDAIDLLALSTKVLTNDSGLMHIAAAVNTKTYALYGATSPEKTPPLGKDSFIFMLNDENLTCQPCFKRECSLDTHKCMLGIKPDYVIKKMNL